MNHHYKAGQTKQQMNKTLIRVGQRPTRYIIGHVPDESFQAISRTGTGKLATID